MSQSLPAVMPWSGRETKVAHLRVTRSASRPASSVRVVPAGWVTPADLDGLGEQDGHGCAPRAILTVGQRVFWCEQSRTEAAVAEQGYFFIGPGATPACLVAGRHQRAAHR